MKASTRSIDVWYPKYFVESFFVSVVLAVRFGFESWFWVGVTFWLFLVCDIGDDKAIDVTQHVPYTGV